jgi:hypothetical protein
VLASGGHTVVEHLPHYLRVKGSSPSEPLALGDKMAKSIYYLALHWIIPKLSEQYIFAVLIFICLSINCGNRLAHTHAHTHTHTHTYIYIYRERERERKTERDVCIYNTVY